MCLYCSKLKENDSKEFMYKSTLIACILIFITRL